MKHASTGPLSEMADKFHFLLQHLPRNSPLFHDDSALQEAYTVALESCAPSYFGRLLLRTVLLPKPPLSLYFLECLRGLNYKERRGLMFLLFSSSAIVAAVPVLEGTTEPMIIWSRLRSHGDQQLIEEIVSYL
jgi:hypothetical protein